jgi:2-keto-4-pentenoate hydratase/2-oxohepta-3-ene-1,7-dioic acid hydratase in catechol pathway
MKIFGIGMNYAAHNKELQNSLLNIEDDSAQRSQPVVFTKADSALLTDGRPFFIPSYTKRCEYETELCVRINHLGRSIPERFAHRYYDAVTVGVDITARDMQERFRREGLPWELCKGFDGSAVLGDFIPVERFAHMQNIRFRLDIDGHTVQQGHTADMLFGIDELVSYVSRFFMLKTGDLIFTGTPVGVGPLQIGQHVEGYLEGEKVLAFNIR